MTTKRYRLVAAALSMVMAMFLLGSVATAAQEPAATPNAAAALTNPASDNCMGKGGKLVIEKRGDGGEYGVCLFEDNRQCEEWALFRGECPVGGIKITGYVTAAARYCAITGGHYAVTDETNAEHEQGTCTLANGRDCDVWAYYAGACG